MSFTTVSDRDLDWLHNPRRRNNENSQIGPGSYDKPVINEKTEVLRKRLEEHRKKIKMSFGASGQERNMSYQTQMYTPGPGFYNLSKSIDVDFLPKENLD